MNKELHTHHANRGPVKCLCQAASRPNHPLVSRSLCQPVLPTNMEFVQYSRIS